jgi:hypothetical protein
MFTRTPDFDSIVRIPENAPEEEPQDEGGMPSRAQLVLARIDAWVLTNGLFADLRDGKISREKAVGELQQLLNIAKEDDLSLFAPERTHCDFYTQIGDTAALAYLLQEAISNLTVRAERK